MDLFCNQPTEQHRMALAKACVPLAGATIPMDRATQKQFQPFVARKFSGKLNYGVLSYAVGSWIDPAMMIDNPAGS